MTTKKEIADFIEAIPIVNLSNPKEWYSRFLGYCPVSHMLKAKGITPPDPDMYLYSDEVQDILERGAKVWGVDVGILFDIASEFDMGHTTTEGRQYVLEMLRGEESD